MRSFFVPALAALALAACGAPADPTPTESSQSALVAPPPKIFPPVPCPSSWCPQATECQTWTCEQPFFAAAPGDFKCTAVTTADGTQCQDSHSCVTNGTCSAGVCAPRQPGDRDLCVTTDAGNNDQYLCGQCQDYECWAERGGSLEFPAPATMCAVVPATR
jgi:hypothetical protein